MELTAAVGAEAHGHAGEPGAPVATRAGLPRHHVRRQRVTSRLASGAPVTLVTGPAGAGKTVAIAEWAEETGEDVASVTTTTSDCFWPAVAEALGVPADLVTHRQGADPAPVGDVVLQLTAVLASRLDRDVVLVVDDYHVGEDASLAASMALFLGHLPDRLRVVIASRRVPSLQLDRLRVGGHLCEIDVEDLLFTPAEAHELVRKLVPGCDEVIADAVVTHAGGWAAALLLGAHGAAAQPDRDAGRDVTRRHLDGYVMRELLGHDSQELVDVLRDVAVVDRFPVALAEAITGRADTADLLQQAQDRGLFVCRVGLRGDHRIHPAVRDTLLMEREARDPARARRCRQRAAAWLEDHGETIPALEQWMAAGDHRNALRLLADRHVELYDAGEEHAVTDLLARLSPDTTAADAGSLIDLAWCELVVDLASFREHVEFATWWAVHTDQHDELMARRLRALQAIMSLSAGDWDAAERLARSALDGLAMWFDEPIVRTSWNDVARAIALSERWDEASDEVREVTVRLSRDPFRTLALETTRALGAALAGCPADALRIASGVRMSPELANLSMSAPELALADVIARRELGDAPDAQCQLEWLVGADVGPMVFVRAHAAAELTQLHLDHVALADASAVFADLRRVVEQDMTGAGGTTLLGRTGTVLALEHGDLDQAQRWADVVDDPFWGPVSRARVAAAAVRETAAKMLDVAVPRSPRHDVVLAMLRARTAADRDAAARWTQAAVHAARERSMLQTLASQGQLDLVEQIAWQLPDAWMDRLRRASAVAPLDAAVNRSLVEPLTVRERDVLRFLPSRLTLKEIADELYVSVNTLKFHLKVIYRKLGVSSRSEAAEVARSWGRVDQR